MPHFAWLPPEINSALIFAGAGSAPLLAAATAWDGLAEDLASSAASFGSVTSDLIGSAWQGESSKAMMVVATQYVGWLSAAAAQAEGAAGQARATATAFETALAATVQPAVVTANRTLVQALVNTNWFGLNAPAIMDTEAAYEQMWALDVAAMFGYHADASAAAAQLAPWQQVLQAFGFHFNSHGHITLGAPGGASAGGGSTQSSSGSGLGNSGSQNLGSGNTGNNNLGFGNLGSGNVGLGNSGNNDFGIGLTGNNQFGFGGFNSGSGNIGFGNSGTGNVGFFNSGNGNVGIGNSGSLNSGLLNSGTANTGFFGGAASSGLLGTQTGILPSHYVTGGLSAANVSSGLLNSAGATTGGFSASLGSPDMLSPALTNPGAAAFAGPANPASAVAGPVSGTPTAGLRAAVTEPAGFFASGNADSGARNPSATRDSGIPNSDFFNKGDRDAVPDAGRRAPLLPE